jgi:hypothetical protein
VASEVVAAQWTARFGLAGLVWLVCATVLVLAVCLYVVCRREAGRLPAALATILGFGGMAATLTPRPQLVSFVLLVVTLGAWLQTARDLRPRWWLVPVSWVWACCHGLWFSGAVLGVVVVAGLFLDRRVRGRMALTLLAVPVLSVVAAAATPIGPRLLLAPFAVGGVTEFITEWQRPSFFDVGPALTAAMIAAVVVLAPVAGAGRHGSRSGCSSLRRPGPCCRSGRWRWARPSRLRCWPAPSTRSSRRDSLGRPNPRATRRSFSAPPRLSASSWPGCSPAVLPSVRGPANVPAGLDGALDALPAHTVIWNDYNLGGWIDYRHPTLEVVADGRAEAFGAAQLEKYGRVVRTEPGWEEILRASGAHVAIVGTDTPLAAALQERLGWRPLGEGDGYVLLSDGTLR